MVRNLDFYGAGATNINLDFYMAGIEYRNLNFYEYIFLLTNHYYYAILKEKQF